jgi:Protein of unknown function (DUF3375)
MAAIVPKNRTIMSLQRENLRVFFEASPSIRLLRSSLAPLVIDLLYQSFKLSEALTLGLTDLKSRILLYQEELHQEHPELMNGLPERYIADWVNSGWLQRFLEANSSEPQFQLTRYSEEVIRFVQSAAQSTALVGTESRLKLIMETLADIVRGASADPNARLAYLRSQRDQIDRQIAEIESGKGIEVYRPAQIRERFQTAVELLRTLQSDFRAVEEQFQNIARDVQQLQVSGNDSRGKILGFALDSEDLLKQQDQGISFFAFVTFLLSPNQQSALRKNIDEVQRLEALTDQREALQHVRRMVPALQAEAEKVMKTTARLSSTLRRLLDANSNGHRLRLTNLLLSIKQTALKLRQAPPQQFTWNLAAAAATSSPLARKFWTPNAVFETDAPEVHMIDVAQAQQLAQAFAGLKRLDLREMRRNIQHCTLPGAPLTLANLIAQSGGSPGIVELLGYLQIAHDDGHPIDPHRSETIEVTLSEQHGSRTVQVVTPLITFLPKATKGRRPK